MKALTLPQPRASAVAAGVKRFETLPWRTDYRGPVLVHAGGNCSDPVLWARWDSEVDGLHFCPPPNNAIVASARLVDVVPVVRRPSEVGRRRGCVAVGPPEAGTSLRRRSLRYWPSNRGLGVDITEENDWADFSPGRFAWVFEDAVALDEPEPFLQRDTGLWSPL